jgi:short-chain Z-isoprenyl diphosphate synthase
MFVSRVIISPDARVPALGSLLRAIYRLYEWRLRREVRGGAMPHHVGIILDGNRRYGELYGINDTRTVYGLGADKLDELLDWCGELGIPAVTLWAFSTDNQRRAPSEVSGILAAIEGKLLLLAEAAQTGRRQVRVRVVGRTAELPGSLIQAIRTAETASASCQGTCLTIALAYGGRDEIADAVRALLAARLEQGDTLDRAISAISTDAIGRHLYTADLPDPDLIIRTSGEARLSGFLLWQSVYSEVYFSDVFWPAFRKIDFLRAIRSYQQRHRRYGL